MQAPLILDYEVYDEDGPCAPYFTGRITDAEGRVICNAENEERAAELVDYIAALRARVSRLEEALKKIADGRGTIPDSSTIFMNGKVPEIPKYFNKYDMQEIASRALRES